MNPILFAQLLQIGQLTFTAIRDIVAAMRAANPGAELPTDDVLIKLLQDNSAAGKAEADALVARMQALVDAQASS